MQSILPLPAQPLKPGTSTGQQFWHSADTNTIDSYSPADGALIARVHATTPRRLRSRH